VRVLTVAAARTDPVDRVEVVRTPARSPLERAVRGYLEHLAVERGLSGNTISAYRRDLDRYLAYLAAQGVRTPGDVQERHVTGFAVAIRTGEDGRSPLAPSSAARTVVAVRNLHKFLLLEGESAGDPTADVRPPSTDKRLPKPITVAEVTRLLEAVAMPGTPSSLRDRALLELLYGCGARIGEAVGLDVDDVDLAGGLARLLGKGGKERVVPVGSYAVAALEAYLVRVRPGLAVRGTGTPALFLNTRGGRLSRQSAWAVLQVAAERAGLAGRVSPHTMRHSFATHLLEGGADVRVVQELLGHASVTTTQIYTKVAPETLREVYVAAHPRALSEGTFVS
jgi:integrase/recombinase XerD